jgi:hypothetical protein
MTLYNNVTVTNDSLFGYFTVRWDPETPFM